MAKYKKGQSGNPKGRPTGSKNKNTSDIRSWVKSLIDDNRETLEADLDRLEALDRWKLITQLLGFVVPKLEKITFDQQIEAEYTQIKELLENAPEEAVNAIYERIINLKKEQDDEQNNI